MKKILRIILPRHVYKSTRWVFSRFGVSEALKFIIKAFFKKERYFSVPNFNDHRGILLRPGTTDMDVFDEIFIGDELDYTFENVNVIVDAGAHIGLTAIKFSILYPKAKIIAIEPEESNYELLKLNSYIYPNIIPVKAPLLGKKRFAKINKENLENWEFYVVESETETEMKSTTIEDLMNKFRFEKIDILKLDIEGSEIDVLDNSQYWIKNVSNIIIELHDRIIPGCTEALFRNTEGLNFSISKSGEKVILSQCLKID